MYFEVSTESLPHLAYRPLFISISESTVIAKSEGIIILRQFPAAVLTASAVLEGKAANITVISIRKQTVNKFAIFFFILQYLLLLHVAAVS